MDNVTNVARGKAAIADAADDDSILRPNIEIPASIWKRAKKAAIDLEVSQSQFVVEAISEKLKRLKAA